MAEKKKAKEEAEKKPSAKKEAKPGKAEKKQEKKTEKKQEKKEKAAKIWKGKDWYVILAPKTFGEKELGEVPATDVKLLAGKKIEVALPELLGQTPKFYMKMIFKISRVEGNKAFTDFNGCEAAKEQIGRIVRKRLGKVESVNDIITQDDRTLHVKSIYILNRKTNKSIETKVRFLVKNFLEDYGKTATLDDFIRGISMGVVQHKIKKQLNKVYPVRIAEIARIRVIK